MRLFLDANILFSAAYADDSTAERLFALQAAGLCTLVTSVYALDEARRNIAAKRPKQSPNLEVLAGQLQIVSEPAPDLTAAAVEHGLPAKDAPILAAAIAAKADVLITGDRMHFGHLYDQTVVGVRVARLSDIFTLLAG